MGVNMCSFMELASVERRSHNVGARVYGGYRFTSLQNWPKSLTYIGYPDILIGLYLSVEKYTKPLVPLRFGAVLKENR